ERLLTRHIDHLADHARAGDHRLADGRGAVLFREEHAVELQAAADVGLAKVELDDLPFLHAILAGAILKDHVHIRSSRSANESFGKAAFARKATEQILYGPRRQTATAPFTIGRGLSTEPRA